MPQNWSPSSSPRCESNTSRNRTLIKYRLPKSQTISRLSQNSRLVSLQNKPTEFPPPAPTATTLQRKRWRSSLRSAQRRRATELCPHRVAFWSISLTTLWRGTKDKNMADIAHNLGWIMSCYADGGRVLELRLFVRKTKNEKKREVKNMKAGSPSNGPFPTPLPVYGGPKIKFSQKKKRHFLQQELFDDFFSFLASEKRNRKIKRKMKKNEK